MFFIQQVRIFPSLKNALISTPKTMHIYGDLSTRRFLNSTIYTMRSRSISTTPICCTSIVDNIQPKLMERLLQKTGIIDVQKYKYIALGYVVYENVMEQIDFPFFFKHFNMADTFFSWFLVTELHVWMIMNRYMAEGKDGKLIRNNVVAAMWEDVNARATQLGPISSTIRNRQITDLSHQFNAAIIGYDEGMQSDDKVLAGTLWRRFFHLECNNPEHLETLIIYLRKQISLFDNLSSQEILRKPILTLIDIKNLCKPS